MTIKRVPPPEWADLPGEHAPETITGVHRVVKRDINWLRAINVGVIVSAVGIALGAWRAIAADAKDAGTAAAAESMREAKAADAKAEAVQRELVRFQQETGNRLDRIEQGNGRTDKKLDALLAGSGIWNPAPTPKDGGR